MKKLITTVFFALLLLLVIPPALEGPVRSLLNALGDPAEHSRAIALVLTGLGIFLFLDRKRIRARRQRRRERRAERRERERLRSSYVLNLSPYEYEEYVAEGLRQVGFTEVDTTPGLRCGRAGTRRRETRLRAVQALCPRAPGRREGGTGDLQRKGLLRL